VKSCITSFPRYPLPFCGSGVEAKTRSRTTPVSGSIYVDSGVCSCSFTQRESRKHHGPLHRLSPCILLLPPVWTTRESIVGVGLSKTTAPGSRIQVIAVQWSIIVASSIVPCIVPTPASLSSTVLPVVSTNVSVDIHLIRF